MFWPFKKKSLKDEKFFCPLPFMHLYLRSDGKVLPCCVGPFEGKGWPEVQEDNLKEVINHKSLQQVRQQFKDGEVPTFCQSCHHLEALGHTSYRTYAKERFEGLGLNSENGQIEIQKEDLKSFDFRFSNLCNFKCRSCGGIFSSRWREDEKILNKSAGPLKVDNCLEGKESLFDEVLNLLPQSEEIYFAGGEPFLMQENLEILERLISEGKTHIPLIFNTNLSQRDLVGKDIFHLINQFSDITFRISVDGLGARGEYIRHGFRSHTFLNNLEDLNRECPNIKKSFVCVLQVYNSFHCVDFFDELLAKGLVKKDEIQFIPLTHPNYFSIHILPDEAKLKLENMIKNRADLFSWQQEAILSQLKQKSHQDDRKLFLKETQKLDQIRGEDFFQTFPELSFLKI